MPGKAIIFDFDGVIALSEHVHCQAWVDLAQAVNLPLPDGFLERGVGSSDNELSRELGAFWQDAHPFEFIIAGKRRYYQQRVGSECHLVPGVLEALENAAALAAVGLATSSCRGDISPLLERYQIERHFRSILTVDDVAVAKPDPEIYLKSAERLGVEPRDCWVFEDSIYGATAAQRAGMNVIGITTTFRPEQLGRLVGHFASFEDWAAIAACLERRAEA